MRRKIIVPVIAAVIAILSALACDPDLNKKETLGKMGESFWVSYQGEKVIPYYTMKFSAPNVCRVREYITENVDLDIKQFYQEAPDGSFEVTDYKKTYATFRQLDSKTIELQVYGETVKMYRQS